VQRRQKRSFDFARCTLKRQWNAACLSQFYHVAFNERYHSTRIFTTWHGTFNVPLTRTVLSVGRKGGMRFSTNGDTLSVRGNSRKPRVRFSRNAAREIFAAVIFLSGKIKGKVEHFRTLFLNIYKLVYDRHRIPCNKFQKFSCAIYLKTTPRSKAQVIITLKWRHTHRIATTLTVKSHFSITTRLTFWRHFREVTLLLCLG